MHFDLFTVLTETKVKFNGVIQAGAHHGQELQAFERLGIKELYLFEPAHEAFARLVGQRDDLVKLGEHTLLRETAHGERFNYINCALGSENKTAPMFIETANSGQSNSLLEPHIHTEQFPHIVFAEKREVPVYRLDDYFVKIPVPSKTPNLLVMDVQGYELEVLKGAETTLKSVDVIVTEISAAELYKGCVIFADLKNYLYERGFNLYLWNWAGGTYGDGVFIKSR